MRSEVVFVALAAQAACGARAGLDEPPDYESKEDLQEVDEDEATRPTDKVSGSSRRSRR